MEKMAHRSLRMKRLITYRTCSGNTVQIFGSNGKRKTCYLTGLRLNIARTVSSRKKPTLWSFGSTLVHLMKQFYYTLQITVSPPMFSLQVVTSTAGVSTTRYRQPLPVLVQTLLT